MPRKRSVGNLTISEIDDTLELRNAVDEDASDDASDEAQLTEESEPDSADVDDDESNEENSEDDQDDDHSEDSDESSSKQKAVPKHATEDLWNSDSDEAPTKTSTRRGKIERGSENRDSSKILASEKPTNEDVPTQPIVPESDSEEDGPVMRNTVGKVPMVWYKDEKHIGYDLAGKKIIRKPKKDTLDAHLARSDDPESWRTVYDEVNDEEIRLTDAEVKLLRRLRAGKFDPGFDPFEDYPDPVDDPVHKIHPLSNKPEPKSRFVPSKHEAKMVVKYVRLMRAGKLEKPKEDDKPETAYNFDLWATENDVKLRGALPIPAPRPKLPGHAESYHPPKEYLLTKEEEEAMLKQDPSDRPLSFLPANHDSLRRVPLYPRLLHERFERCLDLYLCPRAVKKRMNVDPQSLVPKLPRPQELKPFPSILAAQYLGHAARVNALAIHPGGQHLASAADDGTVRLWEVATGRCCRVWDVKRRMLVPPTQGLDAAEAAAASDGKLVSLAWNPVLDLLAACLGCELVLLHAGTPAGGPEARRAAEEVVARGREAGAGRSKEAGRKELVEWVEPSEAARQAGVLLSIMHAKPLKQVAWHAKGDYLVTLAPAANTRAVLIHQLSKRHSQNPFSKSKADAQRVLFHPTKPFLLVANMRGVKVYSLVKQAMAKSLLGGFKWLSSFDVHPGGDNLVCVSLDRRLSWFDMDLSTKPYRTMRYNNTGLRSVAFHRRLPLFAAGGEDGMVYVFHATVFADLMQNPLIVPLKRLRAHRCDGADGVMDLVFHPTQPWLFTCGVDKTLRLFTEI